MANQKQTVRRPEDTGIVQSGSERSDHGRSRGPRRGAPQKTDHGSREDDESRYGDDGAWDPIGQQRYKMRESSLPSQTWTCYWSRVAERDTERQPER